jgi:class 3 adenylate cyclase
LDGFFASRALPISDEISRIFFIMNLGVSSFVVFVFASYFVGRMQNERARANKLLRSILPERIARNLKARPGRVAERFDEVGILFADLVDFTSFAKRSQPDAVIETLDRLFTEFDRLAIQFGVEKIKTIGDAYMVVSGLPDGHPDHLAALARFALQIRAAAAATSRPDGSAFSTRIGIHMGSVVAGVIGRDKFAYDLWGDAVNVASRLETSGEPGRIQVSEAVRAKLASRFEFERRGVVELKGVGSVETWWLAPRPASKGLS